MVKRVDAAKAEDEVKILTFSFSNLNLKYFCKYRFISKWIPYWKAYRKEKKFIYTIINIILV